MMRAKPFKPSLRLMLALLEEAIYAAEGSEWVEEIERLVRKIRRKGEKCQRPMM
jgi:hypothetical protein